MERNAANRTSANISVGVLFKMLYYFMNRACILVFGKKMYSLCQSIIVVPKYVAEIHINDYGGGSWLVI